MAADAAAADAPTDGKGTAEKGAESLLQQLPSSTRAEGEGDEGKEKGFETSKNLKDEQQGTNVNVTTAINAAPAAANALEGEEREHENEGRAKTSRKH